MAVDRQERRRHLIGHDDENVGRFGGHRAGVLFRIFYSNAAFGSESPAALLSFLAQALVIPAEAEIQSPIKVWMPAFAGMTMGRNTARRVPPP